MRRSTGTLGAVITLVALVFACHPMGNERNRAWFDDWAKALRSGERHPSSQYRAFDRAIAGADRVEMHDERGRTDCQGATGLYCHAGKIVGGEGDGRQIAFALQVDADETRLGYRAIGDACDCGEDKGSHDVDTPKCR